MLNASLAVVVSALALDILVGDPVSRWHPVAVFGRSVERMLSWAPAGNRPQLLFGAAVALGSVTVVGLGTADFLAIVTGVSPLAGLVLGALAFKVAFAYRQLRSATLAVAAALENKELEKALGHLPTLVSRDVSALTPRLAASAAIESLAENLCDSVAAPFLYYWLLGVPGALAYRAINTLDAMIGYHGDYEYLGKTAAKLDDWANWIPARLTAGLLATAAVLARADGSAALRMALRDHGRTDSPNAGWPMAAMAGALNMELTKADHYCLGAGGADPTPAAVRRAVRVADIAAGMAAALLLLAAAP